MSYAKTIAGALLVLTVAGCNGTNMAQQAPTAAPTGLRSAGSASVTGGAAAAPSGAGTVGRTSY